MIYINLDIYPPLQDWLDRADALTQDLLDALTPADRAAIIHDNENMWTEIKQHFCDVMNRKCWYSESINDFAHCHVDHFRPKMKAIDENGDDQGGYWWLAFDWTNYRYSGPAGNVRKKDYFQVNNNKANNPHDAIENEDIRFLDPTEPTDPQKLKYDNEGKISEKETNKLHRDYIQAEYTIRRMNLNMIGLIEGRRDKYRKTFRIIRQTQRLLALQQVHHNMARHQAIKAKQKELIELAGKYSEYSAAVKYCLKESGLEWAIHIAIAA